MSVEDSDDMMLSPEQVTRITSWIKQQGRIHAAIQSGGTFTFEYSDKEGDLKWKDTAKYNLFDGTPMDWRKVDTWGLSIMRFGGLFFLRRDHLWTEIDDFSFPWYVEFGGGFGPMMIDGICVRSTVKGGPPDHRDRNRYFLSAEFKGGERLIEGGGTIKISFRGSRARSNKPDIVRAIRKPNAKGQK